MEKLNYFKGDFSIDELNNYFNSLDEKNLKHEFENFINQYLDLSEEEQLKYAEPPIYVCRNFVEKIDKTTEKKISL